MAGGIAAYALVFSFVTVTRHYTFQTHALDLGYYVQLVWNLAGNRGARVSLPEMHAWGDHLSPIMYLFVPAFWLIPGPVALLVAQSAALGLGALPVFAIARRRLGDDRPAAAFAVLYLLNPSLHGINVRDFHAAALAIPLLARRALLRGGGAARALRARRRRRHRLPRGRRARSAGTRRLALPGAAAVALGHRDGGDRPRYPVVDVRLVIPWFRGEPYPHLGRYARHGASLGEIVAGLALHPFRALGTLLSADRFVYLAALLAPLAFLPLFAARDLIGHFRRWARTSSRATRSCTTIGRSISPSSCRS